MEQTYIKVNNLTKDYGNAKGVFNVSFEIKKGEIYGFLGPNGAGKSTAIRHILGFSKPDTGDISVKGIDTWLHPSESNVDIGYLPGEIAFPDNMTGDDYIKYIGELEGIKDYARAKELIEIFSIDTSGKIKKMSKGMKQKVGIISALMNQPEILILDEPTSGLDPIMQNRFIELLQEEKEKGTTILLSSHMFNEVERTCDRVAIIRQGYIVTRINVADIKHATDKKYKIEFINEKDYDNFMKEKLDVSYTNPKKRQAEVNVKDENINAFFIILNKYQIKFFSEIKKSLEDYFMSFYKGDTDNDK